MSEQKPVATAKLNIFLTQDDFNAALKAEREKAIRNFVDNFNINREETLKQLGLKFDKEIFELLSTDESKEVK
jgi:hypothetical protein